MVCRGPTRTALAVIGILAVLSTHLEVAAQDWDSFFQGLQEADDLYGDFSVEPEEPEESFEPPSIFAEGFGSVFHRIYHQRKEHAISSLWRLYNPLEAAGVTIESTITLDGSKNFTGGDEHQRVGFSPPVSGRDNHRCATAVQLAKRDRILVVSEPDRT